MNNANRNLLKKLEAVCGLVESSDFGSVGCIPKDHALQALKDLRRQMLISGAPDILEAGMLFAPTAGLEAVSIENGWGDEFLELARAVELALEAHRDH